MSSQEIAHENKLRELYRKGDENFPDASQVSARVNNRPKTFEKRGNLIALKEWGGK